jgi:hypothetical protein
MLHKGLPVKKKINQGIIFLSHEVATVRLFDFKLKASRNDCSQTKNCLLEIQVKKKVIFAFRQFVLQICVIPQRLKKFFLSANIINATSADSS